MSKYYTIYTKEIAYKLREAGYKIVKTGINKNHPQYDTYIFENSPAFRSELQRITAKLK